MWRPDRVNDLKETCNQKRDAKNDRTNGSRSGCISQDKQTYED
jgi:hypothetical protein